MRYILSALFISLCALPAIAADYFLQPDGTGDYPTIQAAVDVASAGDVIWLNPGTYSGAGNRDIEIYWDIGIKALVLDQPTVISSQGSSLFPHQAFYIETCEPVFYGLTIADGYTTNGGAVLMTEANPTFSYCIFRDNIASEDGGAVYAEGDSYPIFNYTVFDHNSAGGDGGAILATTYSGITVDQGTFLRNGADRGSSIFLTEEAECDLTNSIIAFGRDAAACSDYYGGGYTVNCSNIALNEGGDWVLSLSGMLGLNGNISADPQLCDPMALDPLFAPSMNSASASPACGFQGAVEPDFSWENPVYGVCEDGEGMFATIQDAIGGPGGVGGVVPGGVIALDDGIYNGTGNRDLVGQGKIFTLKARGTNPAACVLDCEGTMADPHRVARFLNGETTDTIFEGLTLTGGYLTAGSGGAVVIQNSSPTFKDCIFTGNEVGTDGGGAVAILGSSGGYSHTQFTNCSFTSNISQNDGGAILGDYWRIELVQCDFSGNQASHYGGDVSVSNFLHGFCVSCSFQDGISTYGHSVHLEDGLDPTVFLNCEFNAPHDGGNASLYAVNPDSLILEGCDFTGNRGINAGAVYVGATGGAYHFLGLQSCNFTDNEAHSDIGYGGAVYADSMTVRIMESTFIGNQAYRAAALYMNNSDLTMALSGFEGNEAQSDGVCYSMGGQTSIVNCLWSGNTAGSGAGVYLYEGNHYLENCDFIDNYSVSWGGVVGDYGAEAVFYNCLFARNYSESTTVLHPVLGGNYLFEQCTFYDNSADHPFIDYGMIYLATYNGGFVTLDRCLITDLDDTYPADDDFNWDLVVTNCNVSGNRVNGEVANYVEAMEGMQGIDGNISQFPIYCNREDLTLTLNENSICLPANNPNGVQIGARGVGCYGLSPVPETSAPLQFAMHGNSPNPFNPRTTISFSLANAGPVKLQVFDIRGHLVKTLISGENLSPGQHEIVWDGRDNSGVSASSGVYFCRLFSGGSTESTRMALLK